MTPTMRYKELRVRLNETIDEIVQRHSEIYRQQAKIDWLSTEADEIRDQMYDLENFDLTDADLKEINGEEG